MVNNRIFLKMPRPKGRTKAVKAAKRATTGAFAQPDSDDDLDVTFDFIYDEENELDPVELYVAITEVLPSVKSKKRGPYLGNASRTKRRKAEQIRHCLKACPMKPLEMFQFQASSIVTLETKSIKRSRLESVAKMLRDDKTTNKAQWYRMLVVAKFLEY